ncbi:MAG: hypothetical protein GXO32_06530 [Crenarchaeota archaeon]|nr:hypothetical protein [Thermoproteota archaeon]
MATWVLNTNSIARKFGGYYWVVIAMRVPVDEVLKEEDEEQEKKEDRALPKWVRNLHCAAV